MSSGLCKELQPRQVSVNAVAFDPIVSRKYYGTTPKSSVS